MQNKRPKSGACFPKIRSVFPKPFICFAKQGRSSLPNSLPSASSLTTRDNPSKTWLLLSLFVPLTFVTSTVLFFFYDKRVAFVTFLYHLSSFYTENKSLRLIDTKPKGYNICCYAILNLQALVAVVSTSQPNVYNRYQYVLPHGDIQLQSGNEGLPHCRLYPMQSH